VVLKTYAYMLNGLGRSQEAVGAWHEVLKIAPQDWEANTELGSLLLDQKKDDLALPYYEAALAASPSSAAETRLGIAYLRAGQSEKGLGILDKVVAADPRPENLNNIAYEIAESNGDLRKALGYAQQAVSKQEKESVDISLATLTTDDLRCTEKLSMFWDTLGWVHFRLGHLDQAESYLNAAWLLSQQGMVADHLGQVYEKQAKREKGDPRLSSRLGGSRGPRTCGPVLGRGNPSSPGASERKVSTADNATSLRSVWRRSKPVANRKTSAPRSRHRDCRVLPAIRTRAQGH
jgi:tetratricopeptide (TPR) repeat protein